MAQTVGTALDLHVQAVAEELAIERVGLMERRAYGPVVLGHQAQPGGGGILALSGPYAAAGKVQLHLHPVPHMHMEWELAAVMGPHVVDRAAAMVQEGAGTDLLLHGQGEVLVRLPLGHHPLRMVALEVGQLPFQKLRLAQAAQPAALNALETAAFQLAQVNRIAWR